MNNDYLNSNLNNINNNENDVKDVKNKINNELVAGLIAEYILFAITVLLYFTGGLLRIILVAFIPIIFNKIVSLSFIIITCFIMPIFLLIKHRKNIKNISSKIKRIIIRIAIIIPLIVAGVILFNYFGFYAKLHSDHNKMVEKTKSYKANPSEYKTVKDFVNELKTRGFLYDEKYDEIYDSLTSRYITEDGHYITGTLYDKGSIIALNRNDFTDNLEDYEWQKIITNYNSTEKYPAYVYSGILLLKDENSSLEYLPFGMYSQYADDYRYDEDSKEYKHFGPYNDDYYIEVKIIYVDGNIYALIGLDSSRSIGLYYDRLLWKKEEETGKSYLGELNPCQFLISEKENITVYNDGKYYTNGAISNETYGFDMEEEKYNDNAKGTINEWMKRKQFPVKKVDKVDVNTVNKIAKEMQNDILKETINNHFNKIESIE